VNLRDSFPGGPDVFFADATQKYFLIRSGFYLAQTLLADAVVVGPLFTFLTCCSLNLSLGLSMLRRVAVNMGSSCPEYSLA